MPTESRTTPGGRAAAPTWVPGAAGGWLDERRRRLVWLVQLRLLPSQTFRLGVASGLVVVWVVAAIAAPTWAPASALSVVIVLGGYFLRLRQLAMLLFLVVTALVYVVPRRNEMRVPRETPEAVVTAVSTAINPPVLWVLAAVAGVVVLIARSRERLGVHGAQGESMLVELRDRLRGQSRVVGLPQPWRLEHAIRSAYGDGFAGDFVIARRSDVRLDVLLVDVSGKGTAAGTRALLLAGAYGGLVGALPTDRLLPAANDYLLEQRWTEGFATAVHVALDLRTGEYAAASAGHPPLLRHRAGAASDPWVVAEVDGGPALGLLPDVGFPSVRGVLEPGDALLLYTDGVVEAPGRDLAQGIDLLARAAGELTAGPGLAGSARRLVDAVAAEDDDRSVVVLWREPGAA